MLSIGSLSSGQGGYYVGMAREDYYLAGGEPPGVWLGEGAAKLGLHGETVTREALENAFEGFDPSDQKRNTALVQNAGVRDGANRRQPGWDLAFSAPKSVSLAWALAADRVQRAIQQAHHAAVEAALGYLQDEHAYIRRGKGGVRREKAQLIVASFEHGTSRAQDPQLHTHALVLNVAIGDETGRGGSLESKPFFRAKMTAGALYRAELAYRLSEIGFDLERTGRRGELFEIAGVPTGLMREASKRRQEIERELGVRGESGAVASASAALRTRSTKGHIPRADVFSTWRQIGRTDYRFGGRELESLLWREPRSGTQVEVGGAPRGASALSLATGEREQMRESLLSDGATRLTREVSHFGENDLLRAVAELAPGMGTDGGMFNAAQLRQMVAEGLRSAPNANSAASAGPLRSGVGSSLSDGGASRADEHLGGHTSLNVLKVGTVTIPGLRTPELRYTTTPLWETEHRMLASADTLRGTAFRIDKVDRIDGAGRVGSGGRDRQHEALLSTALREAQNRTERQATARNRVRDPAASAFVMSDEQVAALRHLADGASRLAIVSGIAGAGKTAVLQAARDFWEAQGFSVVGTAVNGKVVGALKDGPTAIPSMTLARFLPLANAVLSRGSERRAGNQDLVLNDRTVIVVDEAGMVGTRHMASLVDVALKSGAKLALIGEARQIQPVEVGGPYQAILRQAERPAGPGTKSDSDKSLREFSGIAKLSSHEQYVDATGLHEGINSLGQTPPARLTRIVRQQLDKNDPLGNPEWRREAVTALAEGRSEDAIAAHQARGLFHIADTRREAIHSLVEEWKRVGGVRMPEEHLILAGTRDEVRQLNQLAQDSRRSEGRLGLRAARMTHYTYSDTDLPESSRPVGNDQRLATFDLIRSFVSDRTRQVVSEQDSFTLWERDRVVFTRNHHYLSGVGVSNGDTGTVKRIDLKEGLMTVRIDADGGSKRAAAEVTFPYKDFHDISRGYAMTVHKAQGATAKYVYALAGGVMADREFTYVQGSRSQKDTHWFTERIHVVDHVTGSLVDRTTAELCRRMNLSRQKDLAHDVLADYVTASDGELTRGPAGGFNRGINPASGITTGAFSSFTAAAADMTRVKPQERAAARVAGGAAERTQSALHGETDLDGPYRAEQADTATRQREAQRGNAAPEPIVHREVNAHAVEGDGRARPRADSGHEDRQLARGDNDRSVKIEPDMGIDDLDDGLGF